MVYPRRLKNLTSELNRGGIFLLLPVFFLPVLLAADMAAADLYKWIDEAGQVHYTDDPGRVPPEKRKKTETITTKEKAPAGKSSTDKLSNTGADRGEQTSPPLPAAGNSGRIPPPYRSSYGPDYPNLIALDEILPDAEFTGLDGSRHSIRGLRGKIAFLNFWATWCGACRSEMPSMQSLYAHLGNRSDFAMLAVTDEPADKVKAFLGTQQYRFPVAIAAPKVIAPVFGASFIPTTYILDREGRVLYCDVGGMEWDDPRMAGWLRQLVEMR